MTSFKEKLASRNWKKGSFFLSADWRLIPIPKLIEVFASDDFYWAKALPEATMAEMLNNSLTFGLFDSERAVATSSTTPVADQTPSVHTTPAAGTTDSDQQQQQQQQQHPGAFIGVARCITDFVTFAYLTDVWVDPAYQGRGLGTWLIECVKEVMSEMPHLRRLLLFTSNWERSVPFYQKHLDMGVLEGRKGHGPAVMDWKGPGFPSGLDGHSDAKD